VKTIYDVAIIGAGAAGLSLAGELDSSLKVLLIEKKRDPHKRIACAEWVPPMFPYKPVNATSAMVTSYAGITTTKDFKGKIIDRESWQKEMLESLKTTDVHLGEEVLRVEDDKVITNKETYKTSLIVGADGPLSILRKSFGLPLLPVLPAINARVKAKQAFESTFIYFMPEIEKGYGWYFPKGDFANVGVGTTGNLRVTLDYFLNFLISCGMIDSGSRDIAVGFIPLFNLSPKASDNVVLIGDAAGLTDPLTGAGIMQAVDSAGELAKIINSNQSVSEYARYIEKIYSSFLSRRHERRMILENKWPNIKQAVEESWISFSRA